RDSISAIWYCDGWLFLFFELSRYEKPARHSTAVWGDDRWIAPASLRGAKRRSNEAIHLSPGVGMDCFASLAITDGGDCAAYCCDCHCPDRPARSAFTAALSRSAPPPLQGAPLG